ncbi:phenylalanine--tRNA ligase subunit beta [Desulfohalobiaceae bacterium Ax17]|jgi:phenylalanyl-tRNA synthetase beta chain|uniref:phenylalanine--tRNA ligase subunit beta n=1 Tax=Desulfovulcanus ferrireducens TaxID=2831190 RepID=UPI00207BC2C3|nr:phenylalanine--tRNA ligase subunit beta [Desulfovulcanus ferrireducens]MBT8762842.1 phenylalanine--tRNA ligase subunit beta [Desulfovulcanus ferrireducens]
MLLSLNWLREFTPYEGSIEELAERLTMLGLEVEEIIEPFAHLAGVVVGHVLECVPHPNSDHLSLCRVDVGEQVLPIVCGAPNVAKGQKVPVALVGTTMPAGFKIKKAKIRGEVSEGMICSETELELGTDASGIMVLDDGLKPGTPLVQALGLDECVLDIGVTPNRADCLSVLGLAREVATAFDLPLNLPKFELEENADLDCTREVEIIIDDPDLCPLYQARILTGCQVKPSPAWMRYRLMAVGIRPINNIVDVTNYVLMELGQPQHAFDRELLAGQTIRVARAKQGMEIVTLDDQVRKLEDSDLLIWDSEKPVGLAGIMGGANSEINEKSSEVLLECAIFNPPTIRKTARRLGISSEASFRFERGVDQVGSPFALDRATYLMATLSGGKVAKGVAKAEPRPFVSCQIDFRPKRASEYLALDIDEAFCAKTLSKLGCVVEENGSKWKVIPPSYRLDLEREVDLIEEVGRVYGLDKIPAHLPRVSKSLDEEHIDRDYAFTSKVKKWALGLGLQEAINYSFVGTQDLDLLGIAEEGRVLICNPLTEEQNVMRPDLLPGLLQTLKVNIGQGHKRLRLFEVAHTFIQDQESDTETRENNRLGILLYGQRHAPHWPFKEEEVDYTDIKGLADHFLLAFRTPTAQFKLVEDHPYLSPCVTCEVDSVAIGFLGRLKPELAKAYKAKSAVWYADFDLDLMQQIYHGQVIKFKNIPKFPVVRRDMTIVAPLELQYGRILEVIKQLKLSILEDVTLIDIYQPEGAKEKNVTLRFTYRHPEKTLKDKEVNKVQQKVAQFVLDNLDVRFP